MLKLYFFQMSLKTYKMLSNGIEIAIFLQKKKHKKSDLHNPRWLGAPSPDPVRDAFELHLFARYVS